jgi:coatomer protein complex subunit gamma
MVALEAARAICTLKTSDPKEIGATVSILQLMLTSHKPTVRFAAVKTLNMVLIPISIVQTIVSFIFLSFKQFDNLLMIVFDVVQIAGQFPSIISSTCSYDLENILDDSNRSIATLAITTLLKVCSEDFV